MAQYRVIKQVGLLVGSKEYRKDAVINAEIVGEDKIRKYLDRGYIAPIETEPVGNPYKPSNDSDSTDDTESSNNNKKRPRKPVNTND